MQETGLDSSSAGRVVGTSCRAALYVLPMTPIHPSIPAHPLLSAKKCTLTCSLILCLQAIVFFPSHKTVTNSLSSLHAWYLESIYSLILLSPSLPPFCTIYIYLLYSLFQVGPRCPAPKFLCHQLFFTCRFSASFCAFPRWRKPQNYPACGSFIGWWLD